MQQKFSFITSEERVLQIHSLQYSAISTSIPSLSLGLTKYEEHCSRLLQHPKDLRFKTPRGAKIVLASRFSHSQNVPRAFQWCQEPADPLVAVVSHPFSCSQHHQHPNRGVGVKSWSYLKGSLTQCFCTWLPIFKTFPPQFNLVCCYTGRRNTGQINSSVLERTSRVLSLACVCTSRSTALPAMEVQTTSCTVTGVRYTSTQGKRTSHSTGARMQTLIERQRGKIIVGFAITECKLQ